MPDPEVFGAGVTGACVLGKLGDSFDSAAHTEMVHILNDRKVMTVKRTVLNG